MGESCVPNLMLLPFSDLMQWCNKRQKHLDWTNKALAEKSKVPEGTINRIKAGEDDCKYSTIRSILIALIGGTTDEFACTELVEKELRNLPPDELSRRKELCQAILGRNRKVGVRDAMRNDLANVMKSWSASDKQITTLESYGFRVIRNRTHFKVRWNESPYFKTLSCSPSDYRTGANAISELNRKFF